MIDSVSRPKLARGRSYVLKTSELAEALNGAGIDCHVDLVYWSPNAGGSILEGHYWPPNENVPYPRVYVRAGAVPSELRPAAAEALRVAALPRFIQWLQGILALPDASPALAMDSYFNATFTAQGLEVTNRPVHMVRRRAK
jgi:hypothetical protein